MNEKPRYLTKSRYVLGLECPTKLFTQESGTSMPIKSLTIHFCSNSQTAETSSLLANFSHFSSTVEIIQELITIAREIKEADKEGERLNLTTNEVAFYNALEVNDSAVKVLGDETLREIAREIADKVERNATIDWTIRESARAKLMVLVRRTLTKHGYPPDKQQKAIDIVLKQAELMADFFVEI